MDSTEIATFRTYPDIVQAKEVAEILRNNNIKVNITKLSRQVDSIFIGDDINDQFVLKINNTDFSKAVNVLRSQIEIDIEDVDKNHYLFNFTDAELYEILSESEEWGDYDFVLAKKILVSRGKNVDEKMMEAIEKERLEKLSEPKKNQEIWVFAGYLFAFSGGLIGVIMGWLMVNQSKTLPNGEKIHVFNPNSRKHGKNILIIGIIVFIISLLLRFYSEIRLTLDAL